MAGVLATLTAPKELIWKLDGLKEEPKDKEYANNWIKTEITAKWVVFYGILGAVTGLAIFINKSSFTTMGENVTHGVRTDLYRGILKKHTGWFDLPVNGVSVLTSAMAADTMLINGAATESLAPQIEAVFSLFGGIIVGFYFCW